MTRALAGTGAANPASITAVMSTTDCPLCKGTSTPGLTATIALSVASVATNPAGDAVASVALMTTSTVPHTSGPVALRGLTVRASTGETPLSSACGTGLLPGLVVNRSGNPTAL